MADNVRIPVKVEGADPAKQELREVGQAVESVGSAGNASASGTRQVASGVDSVGKSAGKAASGTKEVAKGLGQVDDSAKTAVSGLVSQFNPAMGAAVNLATDLAKGAGAITTNLIALAGAGIALTGIVVVAQGIADAWRDAAEQARKLREQQRKLTEEGIADQERLADVVRDAGIPGTAGEARAISRRLQLTGIEERLADLGAAAQLRASLTDDQTLQFIAGAFLQQVQSGSGPSAGDLRTPNTISQIVGRGGSDTAQQALAARLRDTGPFARAEAPALGTLVEDARQRLFSEVERIIADNRFRDEQPEAQLLRSLVVGGKPVDVGSVSAAQQRGILAGVDLPRTSQGLGRFIFDRNQAAQVTEFVVRENRVGDMTAEELFRLFQRAAGRAGVDPITLQESIRSETSERVIINFQQTNVNSAQFNGATPLDALSEDALLGAQPRVNFPAGP